MFATCLVGSPEVILLDEPLEGMDHQMQQKILSWLEQILADQAVILIASHTFHPFVSLASQAVTICKGKAHHYPELPSEQHNRQRLLQELAGKKA